MARNIFIFASLFVAWVTGLSAGETLPNGIELPGQWPPKRQALPDVEPTPPYLVSPPAVIPIDIGRQLFVDDFLIEKTDLVRRHHRPTPYPSNPVLAPDQPWERSGDGPMAMACSVWVDPADSKFKMWYMAGYVDGTALALSDDGIRWTKPSLRRGTALFWPGRIAHNVILDHREQDPARRFKTVKLKGSAEGRLEYHYSADGIDWSDVQWTSGTVGDCTTIFFNPFRKKYVLSIRHSTASNFRGRIRRYWEMNDFNDGDAVQWGDSVANTPLWTGTDRGLDPVRPELAYQPELYNLDCEPYESLMLGQYSIFRGYFHDDGQGRAVQPGRPKSNEVFVGYSRDGFHWTRPDHRPFLAVSEKRGDWNWGNVRSASPATVVVGDRLHIYYHGRAGEAMPGAKTADAGASTGLAFLRRDGFASMDASGVEKSLTTRPVRFTGKHLFVNLECRTGKLEGSVNGELRVEVLDADGTPLPSFTKDRSIPLRANSTIQEVRWTGTPDLSAVAGKAVKLRFHLKDARLYSFWVSPTTAGASHGYVAGGGPGFTGPTDTLGLQSYPANRPPFATAGDDFDIRMPEGQAAAPVPLDALGSSDIDGKVASYVWFASGALLAKGPSPTVLLPIGRHLITLAVTDDEGATGYGHFEVRVRPTADPTPSREKLVLWLNADDLAALEDGAPVTTWADASGNHFDPAQEDRGKQPVLRRTAANGKPAVDFDGADDFLRTAYARGLLHSFHQATAFVVFRADGEIGDRSMLTQDWSTLATGKAAGGLLYGTAYGSPDGSTQWISVLPERLGEMKSDTWSLGVLVREGKEEGQTKLFSNGLRNDNGAAVAYHVSNSAHALIGCGRGEKSGFWKGAIAEIIVYARAMGDTERQDVERYLQQKYRLAMP